MSQAPLPESSIQAEGGEGSIFSAERVTQALVIAMVILSCVIFVGGARVAGWPRERSFEGSLTQPLRIWPFIVALVLMVVCTGIGTIVLGRRWFLAGLMTAAAGLATWSVRGGRTTYVLLHADTTGLHGGVFILMLIELIVLFGVIGGLWSFIWTRNHPLLPPLPEKDKDQGQPTPIAIAVQAAVMMAFLLIFVYTSQKKQVMTGVFLASLFSTAITQSYFSNRAAGRWYWTGPLLAGAVGYILCAMNPAGLEIGNLSSAFAPMARVLPLDYASMGIAGALLGYWWMSGDAEEEKAAA